jgi:hypothetical protein
MNGYDMVPIELHKEYYGSEVCGYDNNNCIKNFNLYDVHLEERLIHIWEKENIIIVPNSIG